jgi:hypothetical protein
MAQTKTISQQDGVEVVTLLGPLTTIFTPPPDCTSITITLSNGTASPTAYAPGLLNIASSCLPSGQPIGTAFETLSYGENYFSPGICPSSWSSILFSTFSFSGLVETTALCCPSNWGFYSSTSTIYEDPGGPEDGTTETKGFTGCVTSVVQTVITTKTGWTLDIASNVQSTTELLTQASTEIVTLVTSQWAYSSSVVPVPLSSDITISNAAITVNGVWIRYKAGDFPSTSSSSSTASPNTIATSSSTTSARTLTSSSTSPPSSSGLSAGAKIGIGVGAALALLLAALIFGFIFIRRRKARQNKMSQQAEISDGTGNKAELPGSEAAFGSHHGPFEGKPELDNTAASIAELNGADRTAEMEGTQHENRWELDAAAPVARSDGPPMVTKRKFVPQKDVNKGPLTTPTEFVDYS